ncbi:MAG: ATP-binding protein [bacterium]
MEKILANISASLVAPKNLDQVITTALSEIGEYMGLSRVYFMEVRMPENLLHNTHEWCAPDIPSRKNDLSNVPLDSIPKWMEPLKQNQNIVVPDVKNDLSINSPSLFAPPEIRALLIIPIWAHDQFFGLIGFEDYFHPFYWRDEHIRSLRMIAEIFRRSIRAHQTEEELRKTRDQLEAVFNCIADPLDVIDRSYNVLICNPARAAILHKKLEDVIGGKCYEVFHDRSTPCLVCAVADVFQTGKPAYRLRFRKKSDGTDSWSDVFAFPIRNKEGEITQAVEFARDITQRKKAEDEIQKLYAALEKKVEERTQELKAIQEELLLKEKLALIGQLIGSVGHEFRSSMSVLSGTVYLLKNRDKSDNIDEFIDVLEEEIHKMSRFVEDLLDFARTKSPNFQKVDLKNLIERLLQKIDIMSHIQISLDFPENFPEAYIDPDNAEQIFQNLISNAVEAMPSGGTLTIKGVEEDSKVVLSFTDTGVGIPPVNIRRIFTPLFTTKTRGTGLGLAIVNMLIRKNRGKVIVNSVPHQGTTFRLYLPKNFISEDGNVQDLETKEHSQNQSPDQNQSQDRIQHQPKEKSQDQSAIQQEGQEKSPDHASS